MSVGGMTKAQGRRQSKLRAKRAARRASGIVEIHKEQNRKRAGEFSAKKARERLAAKKTPRGTARAKRRGNPCAILGNLI